MLTHSTDSVALPTVASAITTSSSTPTSTPAAPASAQPVSAASSTANPSTSTAAGVLPSSSTSPSAAASPQSTSQQPESQRPTIQQSASQEPATQQPASQRPASTHPASQQPAIESSSSPLTPEDNAPTTTNALSVLITAQDSAKQTTAVSAQSAGIQDPASQDPASQDPVSHTPVGSTNQAASESAAIPVDSPAVTSSQNIGGAIASLLATTIPSPNNGDQVQSSRSADPSVGAADPSDPTAVAPAAIVIGSTTITAASPSQYQIGSQILSPGGSPVTEGGATYSLATSGSAIVVNGVTTPIVSQPASQMPIGAPAAITIGSSVVTANSASQYVIGLQVLAPGGSAIVSEGTTYSLAASGSALVANGATTPIEIASALQTAPPVITVGSDLVTANSANQYVVGSQLLAPGGSAVTFDGSTYSLAPSGTALVVDGQITPVARPAASPGSAITPAITLGSSVITANSAGQYVVGSQTLVPGGSAVAESGSTFSLTPGTTLVVNGVTPAVALPIGAATAVGAQADNSIAPFEYVIGSKTLSAGGPEIVVSGATYSLAPLGTAVIVDGQTVPVISAADPTAAAVFSANGQVYTEQRIADGNVVVEGASTTFTIPPGSAMTLGPERFSAGPAGLVLSGPSGVSTVTFGNSALDADVFTIRGQIYTEIPVSGGVLVEGPSTTTTMSYGASAAFGIEHISMESSALVLSGPSGVTTVPFGSASASAATYTIDGVVFTVVESASRIILHDGTSAATLTEEVATLAENSLSVGSTGTDTATTGALGATQTIATPSTGGNGENAASASHTTKSEASGVGWRPILMVLLCTVPSILLL